MAKTAKKTKTVIQIHGGMKQGAKKDVPGSTPIDSNIQYRCSAPSEWDPSPYRSLTPKRIKQLHAAGIKTVSDLDGHTEEDFAKIVGFPAGDYVYSVARVLGRDVLRSPTEVIVDLPFAISRAVVHGEVSRDDIQKWADRVIRDNATDAALIVETARQERAAAELKAAQDALDAAKRAAEEAKKRVKELKKEAV